MNVILSILLLIIAGFALYPILSSDQIGDTNKDPQTKTVSEQEGSGSPYGTTPAPTAGDQVDPLRPMAIPDDPVADVLYGILSELVQGKSGEKEQAILEARVAKVLELEGMGKEASRTDAAGLAIRTFLARSKNQQVSAEPLKPMQIEAMKVVASEMARDIYRRLPMTVTAGSRHEGSLISGAVEAPLPEGYDRVTWDTLGGWPYKEHMPLPDSVMKLKGMRVGLSGYMMTLEEVEDIHEFVLVESIWACCFGTLPEVHQVILATIPDDKHGVEYTLSPILICGELDVGEIVEDGFVTSLYRMRVEHFEEVQ